MLTDKSKKVAGDIGSLGLTDLIQLLGMTGRTATLVLDRAGRRGRIFFSKGTVLHAEAGALSGRPAFVELLQWTDAEFILEDGVDELPRVTMSESASGLMLSTLTQLDEENSGSFVVPTDVGAAAPTRPKAGPVQVVRRSASPIAVPERRTGAVPLAVVGGGALLLGVALAFLTLRPGTARDPAAAAAGGAAEIAPPAPAAEPEAPPASMTVEDVPPPTPAPVPVATPARASAPSTGVLIANADPGTRLTIDGQPLSGPPFPRLELAPGRHEAVLTGDFVGVARETFTVRAGETLERRFAPRGFGMLKVIAIPWAEVIVDGRSLGDTPLADIRVVAGTHTVTLRNPQLGERTEQVAIEADRTATVRVDLSGS